MMTGRRRTLVRAGAFAVLAVLFSACIKLDMNLTVASDNTVSGTVIFALNKQLIELSGQSADDLLGSTAPVPSGVQGVDTEPYEDDQFQGQKFTFDAVPLAQFNQENGDADQLRISRQGDTFTVTGALDLSSAGGGSGASGATGLSGFPGADEIFKSAQLKITLTFPGAVKSSNGQVNGNTVTWVPKVGERLELHATASAIGSGGSSSSSTTMLLIIAAVVVVAAIVVGILVARRRQPAVAGADGQMGDGAGPISGGDMDGTVVPPTAPPPPPGATPPPPPPPGDPQP
jgi:hypothetical protein